MKWLNWQKEFSRMETTHALILQILDFTNLEKKSTLLATGIANITSIL